MNNTMNILDINKSGKEWAKALKSKKFNEMPWQQKNVTRQEPQLFSQIFQTEGFEKLFVKPNFRKTKAKNSGERDDFD